MFKILKGIGVILMAAILAGCGQENVLSHSYESDLEYVMDKGAIVVGVTEFEPLDYEHDGEWFGFDAEMAVLFGANLGVAVQFVEIDWNKKTALLNNGTIDCVWNGMTLSAKVREEMECTMAYLNNTQMIVIPVQSLGRRRGAEDCTHLLFAVETGSAGEQELKNRNFRYTSTGTQMEALERVASGKADAAVVDGIMAGALLGEGRRFPDLVRADDLSSEEFGIGFRKGSDLAERANDFLTECYQNGVIYEIAEKYGLEEMVTALK